MHADDFRCSRNPIQSIPVVVDAHTHEEENDNVFENREDDILKSSITARLLSFPNVIVTSHQGFLTAEALDAIKAKEQG